MAAYRLIRLGVLAWACVLDLHGLRGEIHLLAVTTATNFTPGLPSPGSLASLFCTGLAGINGVVRATEVPVPTFVAGVQVSIDGIAAPILALADFGSYQQINFQVPWEVQNVSTLTVTQGPNVGSIDVPVSQAWDVFFVDAAGGAIVQHALDYSLVTSDKPARPGEWVIAYASNLGPVNNRPSTGMPTPFSPLSPLNDGLDAYSVLLTGEGRSLNLETNFIGLVPGAIGVYQINLRVPVETPVGDSRLQIQKSRFCGFFFVPDCGRGLYLTFSQSARLAVASQ